MNTIITRFCILHINVPIFFCRQSRSTAAGWLHSSYLIFVSIHNMLRTYWLIYSSVGGLLRLLFPSIILPSRLLCFSPKTLAFHNFKKTLLFSYTLRKTSSFDIWCTQLIIVESSYSTTLPMQVSCVLFLLSTSHSLTATKCHTPDVCL